MNLQIYPALGHHDIRQLKHEHLSQFVDALVKRKVSSITISQYLQSIRLVFKFALINQWIDKTPPFPKIRLSSQPRGGFTLPEYLKLLRTARQLAQLPADEKPITHRSRAGGIFTRTESVPKELFWVVGFMVNSFLRPTDLKFIQHKHVEVVRGENLYLRLTLPETKRHKAQIVTLRPVVMRALTIICFYPRSQTATQPVSCCPCTSIKYLMPQDSNKANSAKPEASTACGIRRLCFAFCTAKVLTCSRWRAMRERRFK